MRGTLLAIVVAGGIGLAGTAAVSAAPVINGSALGAARLGMLAARAGDWGYQGLELCCWGDHFEVQRALSEDDYCAGKLALLNRHELIVPVVSVHRVSQAVCDVIDDRHRGLLPDYVWGDGQPEGVRERAVEELLAEFGITHIRNTPAIALSGGERRRVEIARALATHPSYILLDEPLAGIDPIAVGEIRDLVRHLKDRGIGVLVTDHNVRETLRITERLDPRRRRPVPFPPGW